MRILLAALITAPLLLGATMCGKTEAERSAFDPETDNPMKNVSEEVDEKMKARTDHLEKSLERSLGEADEDAEATP